MRILKADGSLLIKRSRNKKGLWFLSLVQTDKKRTVGKPVPGLLGVPDTDMGDPIRIVFESKESIYGLVTELLLLKAEQFEDLKITYDGGKNETV